LVQKLYNIYAYLTRETWSTSIV